MVKNPPTVWETWVQSLGWHEGMAWHEGMSTHSSVLAWRIPMDRGAWRATVHMVAKSGWDTTEQLSKLKDLNENCVWHMKKTRNICGISSVYTWLFGLER